MRFKTRLQVIFITIIVLPLVLTVMAFCLIGVFLMNYQQGHSLQEMDYSLMIEPFENFAGTADMAYERIAAQAKEDISRLEDRGFLQEINDEISKKSAYVLVRKGEEIYYTGNQDAAKKIFDKLPEYAEYGSDTDSGYYFNSYNKYVKQFDFLFGDGVKGSIFIIARMNTLISREFLIDMFIAILLILIFTGVMLIQWIRKSVFTPVDALNVAMRKIKEGNFDYMLQTDVQGEIGDLYRNYEDMRLRLKESTEENKLHVQQNKELVSNITHDLKTPITAIKGYVEGIMDGVADTPEKMDKYIRTIYNKAMDMDRLINELTIYSGIDNNRIQYNYHRINVADYFGDCVEEVGLDLESKNIKLNYTDLVEPDTQIIADPEQMKKVINNIISNSVKYMDKPNGEINIRILDEVDSIRVELEDNGKGIAQKDLPRIFERFYRTDASRNSAQGGSGIGLSIVKKIIEDHGGYIWATSKEGEGTCIHFVIRKYKELQRDA